MKVADSSVTPPAPDPPAPLLQRARHALARLDDTRTSLWWPAGLAVVAIVGLWPANSLTPTQGLDPSHGAAMAMAAQRGLRFGVQILFTYGPLGFLHVPTLYFGWTALLAEAFTVGLEAALLFLLARNLVRAFGPLAGAAAFAVVGSVAVSPLLNGFLAEMGTLLVFLLALEWMQGGRHDAPPGLARDIGVPAALGAGSGLLLLVKFDAGLFALAAVGTACLLRALPDGAAPWMVRTGLVRLARSAGGALTGAIGSFAALWVLAGQRLADVPAYVRGSLQVAGGYSSAMNIEDVQRRWEYAAAALVALALICLAGWAGARGATRWRRAGPAAMLCLLAAGFFKEGFVRHDGHSLIFFAGLVIAASALWRWLPRLVGVVAVVCAVPLLAGVYAGWASPPTWLAGPGRAGGIVEGLLQGSRRAQIENGARTSLRTAYGIPPADVALLAGHTVHIDPFEASVAWAYPEFVWDPAPVFQTYSAYTVALDRLNSRFLASSSAPEFILRAHQAIDARNPAWESPDYMLEMLCRYRKVDEASGWQVLQRIPSRCGAATSLATIRTRMGDAVTLPQIASGSIEAVQLSWSRSVGEVVRTLAYKDVEYFDVYGSSSNRFVPGTATSTHVMAVPPCVEWNPVLVTGGGLPFGIVRGSRTAASSLPVTVSVLSVPIRCG